MLSLSKHTWRSHFIAGRSSRGHHLPQIPRRDVIIIGAGAAGMMCAAVAGKRGRSVAVIEHARRVGEKIRISGGGRCNFTNKNTTPKQFLSANAHFGAEPLHAG
jgi:hypothetical protein